MKFQSYKIADLIPASYNPRKKLKPGDKEYEKIKKGKGRKRMLPDTGLFRADGNAHEGRPHQTADSEGVLPLTGIF